jgi:hypothetical protein
MHDILGYKTHSASHFVQRLPVHLENQNTVIFNPSTVDRVEQTKFNQTMLTAYFQLNQNDIAARNLLYIEIPKHYCYNQITRTWNKRKRQKIGEKTLPRMYNISPRQQELYALKLLLSVRSGCTSFVDIRTVNGIVFNSFHAAAQAKNLLRDDNAWDRCLSEAIHFQMPVQLRQLFVTICIYCSPLNPTSLFAKYRDYLIEDFINRRVTTSQEQAVQLALHDMEESFRAYGRSGIEFNLPALDARFVRENQSFDGSKLTLEENKQLGDEMYAQLN